MSDDLERLLRDVPARVPKPDERVTRRVRDRLLGVRVTRRAPRVSAGLLVAVLIGIGIGYWAIPHEEPAIGAADPPAVTMDAKPRTIRMYEQIQVAGAVVTRQPGEYVSVEENVCGRGWMPSSGGTSAAGGLWTATVSQVRGNVQLRAKWRGSTSSVVAVKVRPWVVVRQSGRARFVIQVSSYRSLERRVAHLESYNRETRQWKVAARARLAVGSYGLDTETRFRARLPKGTIVRAVVPRTSTRPCNLAGFSNMLTVG